MSTFLIILGIILLLLFLKFIWDSYLTDNTERRWSEYKKSFPVEANRAEREPLRPLPKHLENRPGNLAHRSQSFIGFFNQLHPALSPQVTANDAARFEFKIPVKVHNKIVGYNHVGIQENPSGSIEMYLYHLSLKGKKLTVPNFKLRGNESVSEIDSNLNYQIKLLHSETEYESVVSGKSTKTSTKTANSNLKTSSTQPHKTNKIPKTTLKDEIPLLYKFMLFIKENIVVNDSDLRIRMNAPDEYKFSFPIHRSNGDSWGLCTVNFTRSNVSRYDAQNHNLIFRYKLGLSIKNQEGFIHETEPKVFKKETTLSELAFIFSSQLEELERQDDLPF